MARPKHKPDQTETPERILDAAERVFAAEGFRAATLAEIAAGAGIRRPSLLHHFPSKDALYSACVERAFFALGRVLMEAMGTDGHFIARLEQVVRAFVTFIDGRPSLARILLREVVNDHGPGRAILLERGAPLITEVESFIYDEGAGLVREGLPVRAALMQVISNVLVRAAAGDLRIPLWGLGEQAWTLARLTLLRPDEVTP